MLMAVSQRQLLLLVALAALATIAGAHVFEYLGYAPCELCLVQRKFYYTAIPLALLAYAAAGANPRMARGALYLLTLIWIASAIFGVWHAGIEWKWWAGPSSCTGGGGLTGGLPDLSKPVVMCDQASIRILGLSLAGWNALISAGLAVLAWLGARAQGSSSVSQ